MPDFRIDKFMVTYAEFLSFIEDGGYRNPHLWSVVDERAPVEARASGAKTFNP